MTRRLAILTLTVYTALLVLVAATRAAIEQLHRGSAAERQLGFGQIRFRGAGPEMWALRWRRQRRLVSTLRQELAARLDRVVYLVDAFECVHRFEGAWDSNTGNGYFGGLQFGAREWSRYGGGFAPRADLASPPQQMAAAIAYHAAAGFYPWPKTARACGLIR